MSAEGKEGQTEEGEEKEKIPDEVRQFVNSALLNIQGQIEATNKTLGQLSEAILVLNQKISAGGVGGRAPTNPLDLIGRLLEGEKGGSTDDIVKTVENLVKVSESLDRFRKPSPIGPAEALLMRAGFERLRSPLPRYMTKTELSRYEKLMGMMLGGEEGEETEHFKHSE